MAGKERGGEGAFTLTAASKELEKEESLGCILSVKHEEKRKELKRNSRTTIFRKRDGTWSLRSDGPHWAGAEQGGERGKRGKNETKRGLQNRMSKTGQEH